MEHWIGFLFTLIESLSFVSFFDAFFVRRVGGLKFWGIWGIWLLSEYIANTTIHTQISLLKITLNIILLLIAGYLLYRGKPLMKVLIILLAYALLYSIGLIWQAGVTSVLKISVLEYVNDRPLYTIVSLAGELLYLSISNIVKHIHRPQSVTTTHTAWLAFFPMMSLLLLIPLNRIGNSSAQSLSVIAFCAIILGFANVGIFLVVDLLEQWAHSRQQTLSMSERVKAQEENIAAVSAAYAAQRKLTHDFRNQLSNLANMLNESSAPQAMQYLRELQIKQSERILLVNTNNAAIDAVLNQKAYLAKKQNVDIQFEVNDLSVIKIKSIDCTTVLANLLDNAIEACEKVEEAKRWIEVKVLYNEGRSAEENNLYISVLNTTLPVEIMSNHVSTTKAAPELHGFGIPIVNEILSCYGAESVMLYEDGTFQFSLEWPDVDLSVLND